MSLDHFVKEALSDWMREEGPDSDIVVSSRIRVARNLQSYSFPILVNDEDSEKVLDLVGDVARGNELNTISKFEFITLDHLSELEKKVLVEKHLISPNLAYEARHGAVVLSENEAISIMVNEEDHLRIQCIFPGFQLKEAWELGNQIDDVLEASLDYAFDELKGYVASCPTNMGTGIRASVMMHLPALVMTRQINRLLLAVTQVGLAVRGIYGEGSESIGNLFQVSNQITLGQTEEEIIDNLFRVAKQIIDHEKTARERLLNDSRIRVVDRVMRSYGILTHAATIDSKEAAQRISDVRLGVDLGLIDKLPATMLNELVVMTQPGFLQRYAGGQLSPEERDIRRAEMIREYLTT